MASGSTSSSGGGSRRGPIPSGSTSSGGGSERGSGSGGGGGSERGSGSGGGGSSESASRRGLISCLHSHNCRDKDKDSSPLLSDHHLPQAIEDSPLLSDNDLSEAIRKLIVGFYEEAFNRLPCDAMPDLLRLLTTGGGSSCLGPLDPVSNIILNTIALLPKEEEAASSTSKTAATTISWRLAASRSYNSLLGFLMAYFGCLTKVQATRYLYRADANLLLAVMLIQHDLYVPPEGAFDPESDRTQAALQWAATMARHPSPTMLANLMSIHLKDADFCLMNKCFSGQDVAGAPLTVDHVWAIHHIVHKMMTPMCFANIVHIRRGLVINYGHILEASCSEITTPSTTVDAKTISTTLAWAGTSISSLQSGVLSEELKDCLRIADKQKHYLKNPCGSSDACCDYLQTLDMFVNAMIHNLYITALKLLPTPSGSFLRSILKAGHCYGSMDPLSNIIVNSIWYNCCGCDLPVSERREIAQCNDVLDPLYLLRTQLHSLKGLTKLAAYTDPQFSVPDCALELLCSAKCDIAHMLASSTPERSAKNPFQEAAEAAGHPLPLCLGELHQQLLLMPEERSKLRSLITKAQTNGTLLHVDAMTDCIVNMWNRNRSKAQTVEAPVLCAEALMAVSSKRSEYQERRGKLRSKIEQLLKEYMAQQFPGPEYKLGTILGVVTRNRGPPHLSDIQYNVNFTAARDVQLPKTLFFTEFYLFSRVPKPEFCCPLPYAYAGRCYYGVDTARKIVYPDDAKYIPDDITHPGTRKVDGMLAMDLVYFSPKFDVELAVNLNMLGSEEEEEPKKKRRRV